MLSEQMNEGMNKSEKEKKNNKEESECEKTRVLLSFWTGAKSTFDSVFKQFQFL